MEHLSVLPCSVQNGSKRFNSIRNCNYQFKRIKFASLQKNRPFCRHMAEWIYIFTSKLLISLNPDIMESVNATYEIQTSLDSLALDLEKFEEQLMPQLDSLAKAIPEIYAGYASMVRTLVSTTLQVCKPNAKTSSRIALAVEVGARSIQAFGNYKAAKEHNRLLTKYIAIKRQHAENNLDKVSDLLPKINAKCTTSGKLFSKCASLRYALSELDSSKISRVAQIQYKALSLHRTNLYLSELCKYLNFYKANKKASRWIVGYIEKDQAVFDEVNSVVTKGTIILVVFLVILYFFFAAIVSLFHWLGSLF